MIKCKRLLSILYVPYYNLNCKQLEIAHTTRHHTVSYSAQQRFSITSEHEAQSNTRHKKSKIVSHNKNKIKCKTVKTAKDIYKLGHKCDVVGIDEAQFFDDGIIEVCNGLANSGVRVIVAGLDMDYTGKPFGPMANLMATAEYVTKVHAICPKTGGLAQYSYRKTKNKDLILLGKEAEYMPLSRSAYYKKTNNKKKGK